MMAKVGGLALLAATNGSWLVGYLVVDSAMFLSFLVARGDLILQDPIPISPAAMAAFSIITRLPGRHIGGFTGSLLMRLPSINGGLVFAFDVATAYLGLFVAIHLYNTRAETEGGAQKVGASSLWAAAGCVTAAAAIAWAYFVLALAVPRLRHSLYSPVSGRQYALSVFEASEEVERKILIFTYNRLLWESEIGDDVRRWTHENWGAWVAAKPGWFTKACIAQVPDSYIPNEFLNGLGGAHRRRRGSAAGSIRESFRESMRGQEE